MTDGPKNHPFKQVDVFSRTPFNGNPVAVVFDAEGLDTAVMQKIAAWTNLSETTFLLPPTVPAADYRLRIFAPRNEMRFAGHPTLGSAHAALEAGLIRPRNGRLVQECLAGSVALRVEEAGPSRTLWVTVPTPRCELLPQDSAKALESALGCKGRAGAPAIVDVGPRWLIMNAASAAIVDGLVPDMRLVSELSRALGVVGVTIFGRLPDGPAAVRVRSFAPAEGVPEDSVCGSGNAMGSSPARGGHSAATASST